MILALDPGRDKVGLALVGVTGGLFYDSGAGSGPG